MNLELGIVSSCTSVGCRVRLLDREASVDALYSGGMIAHGIEVLPGDLVAVDLGGPPQAVFRWALGQIERVEGEQMWTLRSSHPLARGEGLPTEVAAGDEVFFVSGKVQDVATRGRPVHADRLRALFYPVIRAMHQPSEEGGGTAPGAGEGRVEGMPGEVEYLTAETERGLRALSEVMGASYEAGTDDVPPEWAQVRVVDGVPVSFILVDPDKAIEFPGGDVKYAFINDVATRADRRREGHFRALMEHTLGCLRRAGFPFVVTHGRDVLYRQFGFDVFTHHSGIWVTPDQIDRTLGIGEPEDAGQDLTVEDRPGIVDDLLLVTEVQGEGAAVCRSALQAAAAMARERQKTRILFEYPPAPSYGSRYPLYGSPEGALTALARTCGAQVCVQGADPESGSVRDADWIVVLDALSFVQRVVERLHLPGLSLPQGAVSLRTDAGEVTIESSGDQVLVSEGVRTGSSTVEWPSSALAQLLTGYRSAEVLSEIHRVPLPASALALLDNLFPPKWRFFRNESWTLKG